MSVQIALMAASTAMQVMQSVQEARAGEQQALYEEAAFKEDANMARLEAEQAEVNRREEFALLEATNRNLAAYDPYSSPSFLALSESNKDAFGRDVRNIQLGGAATVSKLTRSAAAAGTKAKAFNRSGRMALLSGIPRLGAKLGKYQAPTGSTSGSLSGISSAGYDSGAELQGGL